MKKGLRLSQITHCHSHITYVGNIDLMKKGLRLEYSVIVILVQFLDVRNIDLMKKGLKALLEAEHERITL